MPHAVAAGRENFHQIFKRKLRPISMSHIRIHNACVQTKRQTEVEITDSSLLAMKWWWFLCSFVFFSFASETLNRFPFMPSFRQMVDDTKCRKSAQTQTKSICRHFILIRDMFYPFVRISRIQIHTTNKRTQTRTLTRNERICLMRTLAVRFVVFFFFLFACPSTFDCIRVIFLVAW